MRGVRRFHLGAINRASTDKCFPCREQCPESDNCYDPFVSNFDIHFQWTDPCLTVVLRGFARMEKFQVLCAELLSQVQNTSGNQLIYITLKKVCWTDRNIGYHYIYLYAYLVSRLLCGVGSYSLCYGNQF